MKRCPREVRSASGRPMRSCPWPFAIVVLVAVGVLLAPGTVHATNYYWQNAAGGEFGYRYNWSPNTNFPRTASDAAFFAISATYEVDFVASPTNERIEVRAGDVTFVLAGHSYNLRPGTGRDAPPAVVVGTTSGTSAVLHTQGTVDAQGIVRIGRDSGSVGKVEALGDWDVTNAVLVGQSGNGILWLTSVGDLTGTTLYAGYNSGAFGSLLIDIIGFGGSPSIVLSDELLIGRAGHGSMTIDSHGTVTNDGAGFVAQLPGSTGTVQIGGSIFANGVEPTWTNNDALYVGGNATDPGGIALVTVDLNGVLAVATDMRIWSGGTVAVVGSDQDNSAREDGLLTVGGTLTLEPSASLDIQGGAVEVGTLISTVQTVQWTAGALTLTNGDLQVDLATPLGPNLQLNGNKVGSVSGAVEVGPNIGGSMVMLFGATLSSDTGIIGSTAPGSILASAVMASAGTTWEMTGDLHVRGLSGADLAVSEGAVLSNNDAFLASPSGTSADVDLFDVDTQWNLAGSAYLGGDEVTLGGIGTLDVRTGATMAVVRSLRVWDNFTLTIDGGNVSASLVDVTGTVDVPAGTLDVQGGTLHVHGDGSLNGQIVGDPSTQVTVEGSGATWTLPGTLVHGSDQAGPGHIGPLSLLGGTINADVIDLGATPFAGFGTLHGDVVADAIVTATGTLTLGDADSFSGAQLAGGLDVGPHTVTINKAGFFNVGVFTAIDGGTLNVPNGVAVPVGNSLIVHGTISGRMAAQSGSLIWAVGELMLGDAASPAGFFSDGELLTSKFSVTIQDANEAVLGSLTLLGDGGNPGSLIADNGAVVEFGKNVVGYGVVTTPDDPSTPLINNGAILGDSPSEPIELTGYVKGVGTMDNVVITGTDAPGFSTASVYRGNMTYGGKLIIEIGGLSPGSEHDRINHSGVAALGGVLQIELIDGYVPQVGDRIVAMTFRSSTGEFVTLTAPGGCGDTAFRIEYSDHDVTLVAVEALPGDINVDGRVDLLDYAPFPGCVTGPAGSATTACQCHDIDGSGAIDLRDFGAIQAAFGSN